MRPAGNQVLVSKPDPGDEEPKAIVGYTSSHSPDKAAVDFDFILQDSFYLTHYTVVLARLIMAVDLPRTIVTLYIKEGVVEMSVDSQFEHGLASYSDKIAIAPPTGQLAHVHLVLDRSRESCFAVASVDGATPVSVSSPSVCPMGSYQVELGLQVVLPTPPIDEVFDSHFVAYFDNLTITEPD
jgi:hypothetical protein